MVVAVVERPHDRQRLVERGRLGQALEIARHTELLGVLDLVPYIDL